MGRALDTERKEVSSVISPESVSEFALFLLVQAPWSDSLKQCQINMIPGLTAARAYYL